MCSCTNSPPTPTLFLQIHPDIGKGGIAGFREGALEAHLPVVRPMVTVDAPGTGTEIPIALIGIFVVGIGVLPDVLQRRHDFEGGAGRILSLGHTVQQYRAVFILHDGIPDCSDFIGVEARMGHHGQYLPRVVHISNRNDQA